MCLKYFLSVDGNLDPSLNQSPVQSRAVDNVGDKNVVPEYLIIYVYLMVH